MKKINKEDILAASKSNPYDGDYVKVGISTCGVAAGAQDTLNVFEEETKRLGIKVDIRRCGCIGMCYAEPLVEVSAAGLPKVTYGKVDKNVALEIIQEHLAHGRLVDDYIFDMPMNR